MRRTEEGSYSCAGRAGFMSELKLRPPVEADPFRQESELANGARRLSFGMTE